MSGASGLPRLSRRQAQALRFIRSFMTERGFAPTLREIGLHMGINSTNGVTDHLHRLEKKGYISRLVPSGSGSVPARAIRVLMTEDGTVPVEHVAFAGVDDITDAALKLPDAALARLCARLLVAHASRISVAETAFAVEENHVPRILS